MPRTICNSSNERRGYARAPNDKPAARAAVIDPDACCRVRDRGNVGHTSCANDPRDRTLIGWARHKGAGPASAIRPRGMANTPSLASLMMGASALATMPPSALCEVWPSAGRIGFLQVRTREGGGPPPSIHGSKPASSTTSIPWLALVLAKLPDHPAKRIDELLPWNWKASQEQIKAAA
jgi:hypothetical protein